jgi:hypothetical protein
MRGNAVLNSKGTLVFVLTIAVFSGGCTGYVSSPVKLAAAPLSIVTQPANQTVTAGQTATFTITAAGTAPLSYQWQKNGVDISGATAAAYTTSATIPSDDGSQFRAVVSNSGGSVTSNPATLTVRSLGAVAITNTQLPNGTNGTGYVAALTVTGGLAPYTWSVKSGNLPNGLTLLSGGTISGTPSVAGNFSFTIQVQDSSSSPESASKNLSIAIASAAANPVQITTTSLPNGPVNSSYSFMMVASGGTTPYRWSITSGSLPAGLTMSASGQISGTPSAAGTFSFTIQVADSSSPTETATQAYSITFATPGAGVPLTVCQILANTGTTYILQNDVSGQGSCFNVQADNITLNLNGHTVTYADPLSITLSQVSPAAVVFGIYGAASWDPNFSTGIAAGNTTGGSWNNLTVAGPGTITQGNCLSPSDGVIGSNAIHMGQGAGDGLNVYNVTFNICADSTQAIFADSRGARDFVHDNTVNDRVVTAQKRSIYQGVAFVCDNGCDGGTGGPSYFYNNTIIGGPQGGIVWNNPGTVVHDNIIKQGNPGASPGFLNGGTSSLVCGGVNANPYNNVAGLTPTAAGTQCSNDFGIFNQAANVAVFSNTIQAQEGRGISLDGTCWNPGSCTGLTGQTVHDDVVTAQEFPNNSEYHGCELGGAWGLEWRDGPVGSTIYNENITAISGQCQAGALRTQFVSNYNNISHNNTYSAKRAPGSPSNCTGSLDSNFNCAYAAAFFGAGNAAVPTQFVSQNDTFIADSALLFFDWDASPNHGLLISPTFQKGNNPDTNYFHFAVFRNGAGTVAMHIRDAKFGSGVNPTDTDLPAQGADEMAASLYLDWTLTLTVQNQAGNPVPGANVSYTNGLGGLECNATTNSSGVATCILTQYRDNNDTGANQIENHNPFSFKISATGCTTLTGNEPITGITAETKILPGC